MIFLQASTTEVATISELTHNSEQTKQYKAQNVVSELSLEIEKGNNNWDSERIKELLQQLKQVSGYTDQWLTIILDNLQNGLSIESQINNILSAIRLMQHHWMEEIQSRHSLQNLLNKVQDLLSIIIKYRNYNFNNPYLADGMKQTQIYNDFKSLCKIIMIPMKDAMNIIQCMSTDGSKTLIKIWYEDEHVCYEYDLTQLVQAYMTFISNQYYYEADLENFIQKVDDFMSFLAEMRIKTTNKYNSMLLGLLGQLNKDPQLITNIQSLYNYAVGFTGWTVPNATQEVYMGVLSALDAMQYVLNMTLAKCSKEIEEILKDGDYQTIINYIYNHDNQSQETLMDRLCNFINNTIPGYTFPVVAGSQLETARTKVRSILTESELTNAVLEARARISELFDTLQTSLITFENYKTSHNSEAESRKIQYFDLSYHYYIRLSRSRHDLNEEQKNLFKSMLRFVVKRGLKDTEFNMREDLLQQMIVSILAPQLGQDVEIHVRTFGAGCKDTVIVLTNNKGYATELTLTDAQINNLINSIYNEIDAVASAVQVPTQSEYPSGQLNTVINSVKNHVKQEVLTLFMHDETTSTIVTPTTAPAA